MRAREHVEAERCLVAVRWQLLESYALSRQEGLVEPTGLVIDLTQPYGRTMAEVLFAASTLPGQRSSRVSCMERSTLAAMLREPAPAVAEALRGYVDDPGCFTAVVLGSTGLVLTGTWQELITANSVSAKPREGFRHGR